MVENLVKMFVKTFDVSGSIFAGFWRDFNEQTQKPVARSIDTPAQIKDKTIKGADVPAFVRGIARIEDGRTIAHGVNMMVLAIENHDCGLTRFGPLVVFRDDLMRLIRENPGACIDARIRQPNKNRSNANGFNLMPQIVFASLVVAEVL